MRDRLHLARDLLSPSGSIFVQISDENVHHVTELTDEKFGKENRVAIISFKKTGFAGSVTLSTTHDFIIRLNKDSDTAHHLVLETKGFDPLEDVKKAAAERWVKAVNEDGNFGIWHYAIARKPQEVVDRLNEVI